MSEKNTEIRDGLDQYGKACGSEGEPREQLNKRDTEGHPEVIDDKIEEDLKWPCGACGEDVTVDGVQCGFCKKWYHVDECTESEVISPNEYLSKPYTCPKCIEKSEGKAKKVKDSTNDSSKVKRKAGRPPRRVRSNSIPSSLTEEWVDNNINNKRNIDEVGSPDKTESKAEEKKRKKDRERTEKVDENKEEEEVVIHSSPLKSILGETIYNFGASLLGGGGKGKEQEEKEENDKQTEREQKEERQKEKVIEKDEKEEEVEGGIMETQKEHIPAEKDEEIEIEKEKIKPKTLDQKGKMWNNHIEYKGIKITREDLKSLEGENWITSTALEGFLAWLGETMSDVIKNNKILLIQPSIAQIFQYGDRKSAHEHRNHFNTNEYDWIFYPVQKTSYPETEILDGGLHWSLMIFSKKEHAFYHYDSIRGMNNRGARRMVVNMGDENDFNDRGQWPAFYEADCSRQDNNWACGSYLMHFMYRTIKTIGEGRIKNIGILRAVQYEVLRTRNKLRQEMEKSVQKEKDVEIIHIGKGGLEKKQDIEGTEREISKHCEDEKMEVNMSAANIEKTPESEKRKNTLTRNLADINKNLNNTEQTVKTNKECRYYLKGFCRRGEECRFEHREKCGIWMKEGICTNSRCRLAHPYKCKYHESGDCRRQHCRYLHINKRTEPAGETKQDKNAGTMNQGLMNGQYLGIQGRNWNQNQYVNGNFHLQNQMDYRLNPAMAPWGMQQMYYGGPITMDTIIRAGWETLSNQGNRWRP